MSEQAAVVRLYDLLDPKRLKPLCEIVLKHDQFDVCLCDNCRNFYRDKSYRPCYFRENYAWKRCKHHEPIARNAFLAEKVLRLTEWLSLEEAIGLMREELGEIFEPLEKVRMKGEKEGGD